MGECNEAEKFEFEFVESKCTRCKLCEKVCAYTARKLNGKMELDEEECRYCGLCISVCPTGALKAIGR